MSKNLQKYSNILLLPYVFVISFDRNEFVEKDLDADIKHVWLTDSVVDPPPKIPDPKYMYFTNTMILAKLIKEDRDYEKETTILKIISYIYDGGFYRFSFEHKNDRIAVLWVEYSPDQDWLIQILLTSQKHPDIIPLIVLDTIRIIDNVYVSVQK